MAGKRSVLIGMLLLGLAVLLFPMFAPTYLVHIGVFIAINGIAVLGLGVLGGFAGQLSLGQAAFYGIGAYTSALLTVNYGFSFWVGLVVAILVVIVAGVAVGIPTLRVSGLYLVMTTIGVNEIVWLVMMNWEKLTRGSQGVLQIPAPVLGPLTLNSPRSFYYLAIGLLAFFLVATVRVGRSRLGVFFRALNDSEIAASMVGVNTVRAKVIAFVISAVWAGVAGVLYAHYVGYIHPDNFKLDVSVLMLTMAVLGGQRSVFGMLLATAVLTGATEYLRNIGEYRMVVYGLLLLLGAIYVPGGTGPYLTRLPALLATRLGRSESHGGRRSA